MSGTARRLAFRYLPPAVSRLAVATRDRRRDTRKAAGRRGTGRRDHDAVVEALRWARSLPEALVAEVRELLASGEPHTATAVAASLHKEPETAAIGALAGAIVSFHRGYVELAWHQFQDVPRDLWRRHAASEFVRTGIHVDRETALEEVRRLLDELPDRLDTLSWLHIVGAVYGAGDEDLARQTFAVLDGLVGNGSGVTKELVVERDWLRPWVAASGDSRSAPAVAAGHVSFAVMDYGHPGRSRASANIGDHIQSIASLGHLVRHQNLAFHGRPDIVDLLLQLRGRVRPEMQLVDVTADVDVITVDRDASMYKEVPPNTWTLAFGWFMHAIFESRYGFPFHRNLLPIFLSFHCNKRELLTPDALDYLRKHGPIGCRDWTTVDVLLSLDVPAFFSGCLTTTISTVFPDLPKPPRSKAPVAYVDMPRRTVPPGAATYRHSSDAVRFRSFTDNVYVALERLETYRRRHSAVVTSRLHCWLPARSIGIPVDFQPKNRSDIRFAGLIDTAEAEFEAIRDGINAKLEQVLTAILTGEEPDAVYALWRALTADDVEAARRRHEAPAAVHPAPAGILDDARRAVAATVLVAGAGEADDIHLAVHLQAERQDALAVLIASAAGQASRGLHVWVLTREPETVDAGELAALFPDVTISVVPTRGLGADLLARHARRLAPSDIDLLLLNELLPSVERVVVLPVDAVVTHDIAELYDTDLGVDLVAAPTVVGTAGSSGFGVIHQAALRLGPKTVAATELRRQAYARHTFDFDAFTTDVLVLDLARSRSEGFRDESLPYVDEFGLTLRQALHLIAGPHRAVLPERWDCVPTRSVVDQPGVIHWADPVKPWDEGYTAERERWLELADTVDKRRTS